MYKGKKFVSLSTFFYFYIKKIEKLKIKSASF